MLIAPHPTLVCPHDGASLTSHANSYVCPHGHSFDRAREGYVNLLPVGDKASRDPGDSKQMVAARRRFLETGGFEPIATAVAHTALALIIAHASTRPFTILDAGCGEGYYLQHLEKQLETVPGEATVHLTGIDISKWAVRAAAKRAVPATWVVASNRRPPVPPASIDLVLCIFGFPIWPGFASVQPAGGHVLMIDPGPDHLLEMREIIYPEVIRRERGAAITADGYTQVSEHSIHATAHLATPGVIADLLSMTPHAHRANMAGQAALATRATLDVTIDVALRLFRRT